MVGEGIETDVSTDSPKKISPGEMLQQARINAGLTQEQVAKELYMTVYKVNALEADDYKRLNSDTFARGYIRAYANLVKMDVVSVLAAYDTLMDEFRVQTVVPTPVVVNEPGHRGAWHFLAVIAAFFIGLWLISVWFFDNHSDAHYTVALDSISSLPSVPNAQVVSPVVQAQEGKNLSVSSAAVSESIQSVAATSVASAASSVASTSQASAASALDVGVIAIAQASAASEQSSAASARKTTLDELSFSFRAESWLEVSDSRGDVLATELQPAGSKLKLVGMAPFDVKLGNSPAVDVQLNGKKIDVIPLMGSNVLIMKIGD